MTREEFESVQKGYARSGRSLKSYLKEQGIPYTTFHYWRKKIESEQESHPIAPITLRNNGRNKDATVESCSPTLSPEGVMVAFPNGLRAHFGRGSERLLMDLFTQSLRAHVLPQ